MVLTDECGLDSSWRVKLFRFTFVRLEVLLPLADLAFGCVGIVHQFFYDNLVNPRSCSDDADFLRESSGGACNVYVINQRTTRRHVIAFLVNANVVFVEDVVGYHIPVFEGVAVGLDECLNLPHWNVKVTNLQVLGTKFSRVINPFFYVRNDSCCVQVKNEAENH